jgi:lipopolysaccharide transport system ATP-binding protein
MSEIILEAENLSKKYCLDLHRSLHYGFQDIFSGLKLGKNVGPKTQLRHSEFWALKDLTFRLQRGESIGIVGKNGSGKSTLLKILNGTIKPTSGIARIYGKMRLLALGTGFNPLLSGMENIRVACALFGFGSAKTRELTESILDFCKLEEFIDAPVKTYSSGMYARLGFAIAIHTEPDILLVDEALAVGDISFVSKCMRKIKEFRGNGGSLVLVTHAPYTVRSVCDQAIWIDKGQVKSQGVCEDVCVDYENEIAGESQANASLYLSEDLASCELDIPESIVSGQGLQIRIQVKSKKQFSASVGIYISVFDASQSMLWYNDSKHDSQMFDLPRGETVFSVSYEKINLAKGKYFVSCLLYNETHEERLAYLINAKNFIVEAPSIRFAAGIIHQDCKYSIESQ